MALVLKDLLPRINFKVDSSGSLDRFINEVLQPVLDLLVGEVQRWVDQNDVDLAEETTVDAMLRDLGNPFLIAFSQPLNRKRLLVRVLIDVYKGKGSAPALEDVILALTGIEATALITPATIDSWVLDVDTIGDTAADPPPANPFLTDFAILGASAGFMRYSFEIEVPVLLNDEEREIIVEIVRLMKPAHTHFIGFKEPGILDPIDHWELDLSYLHQTGEPLVGDETDLFD